MTEELLSRLEVSGTPVIEPHDDSADIVVETEESGLIIGYHGEILEALQLMVSLMASKKSGALSGFQLRLAIIRKIAPNILRGLLNRLKIASWMRIERTHFQSLNHGSDVLFIWRYKMMMKSPQSQWGKEEIASWLLSLANKPALSLFSSSSYVFQYNLVSIFGRTLRLLTVFASTISPPRFI